MFFAFPMFTTVSMLLYCNVETIQQHVHITTGRRTIVLITSTAMIGRKLVRHPSVTDVLDPTSSKIYLALESGLTPQLNCMYSSTTNRYPANRFHRSITEYAQNIVLWNFPTKILKRVMIRYTKINKKKKPKLACASILRTFIFPYNKTN
jgi:hypothetical protein